MTSVITLLCSALPFAVGLNSHIFKPKKGLTSSPKEPMTASCTAESITELRPLVLPSSLLNGLL